MPHESLNSYLLSNVLSLAQQRRGRAAVGGYQLMLSADKDFLLLRGWLTN